MTLDEYLKQVKERCEKATEGPWEKDTHESLEKGCRCLSCWETDGYQVATATTTIAMESEHDANFIAHARTDVPRLVEIIEQERERAKVLVEAMERMKRVLTDKDLNIKMEGDFVASIMYGEACEKFDEALERYQGEGNG